MVLTPRRAAVAALALTFSLGLAGCGGDDEPSAGTPSGTPTVTPSSGASDPGAQLSDDIGMGMQPVAGLPSDFPTTDVPLLPGEVTQPIGATDREHGWLLDIPVAGTRKACFDRAVALLLAKGFLLNSGPNVSDANIEALYLSPEYRVIVTATKAETGCTVQYAVATNDPPAQQTP